MRIQLALVSLAAAAPAASAQCGTTPRPQLTAPLPGVGERFGETVRTDGTRAIVGAYANDALGGDAGMAHVYRLEPSGWVFEASLVAPDGAAQDHFARSAAISGEWALVGSYQDDDLGSNSGSAHLFRRSGALWSHFQKVVAPDGDGSDRFGRVVGLHGDVAVVGAPFDEALAVDCGSAYVYRWDGAIWGFQQKLLPSDGAVNDRFGKQFAVSDELIVTGASIHGFVGAPEAGQGYVYRWNGATWDEEARLAPPLPQTNERMGVSTAVTGSPGSEVVVLGASDWDDGGIEDCGAAYVYRRIGGAWTYEGRLVASDRAPQDNFGWTVAIDGDTILVGAPADDAPLANQAGATYVFRRRGAAWVEVEKLTAAVPQAGEELGVSIALAGGQALLGANFGDVGATLDAGRVVAFEVLAPCIEPFCFGDGGGTACPCGNASAVGAESGCLSSLGQGGRLMASGTASIASDSLVLAGSGMPDSSALYFQGNAAIALGFGAVLGDGLVCTTGSVVRLGSTLNVSGASLHPAPGGPLVSVGGAVPPGAIRHYQVRYRNSAVFCTPDVFNLTNGVRVVWSP